MKESRKKEGIDSLYRISSVVGRIDHPKEALDFILREMVRVFHANSASVSLIHPDRQELQIEAACGLPEESLSLSVKLGAGITGWVALHGQPLLVCDTQKDPRYITIRDGVRSEVAVPMEDQGGVFGVVNLDSDQPDNFAPEDVKLLTLLTREAARAVQQLWVVQQLKQRAEQMESLLRVGQQIISKMDLKKILDDIAGAGREVLRCRFGALFLLKEDGETLELHSLSGEGCSELYHEEIRLEQSSVGTSLRHGKQIEVYDLPRTEEHHFVDMVQKFGLVSMLATPLHFEKRPIGVLCAYIDHPYRFNNDEKKVMQTLASLGAIAIENSRLYRHVIETEEHLNRNDKLTTLGLLSAEIAHEIRNPLTVLQLLFKSIDFEFAEEDPRHEDLHVIGDKIQQLEAIVSRVLDFGKSGDGLKGVFPMTEILRETLHLVRMKIEQSNVSLEYTAEGDEDSFRVNVNKGQIQQALLNLIINALEAMPNGGTIRIQMLAEEEERVVVIISDTGTGVPDELRDKIFESFLTGRKNGTGLGLAIVKRIVRSHRGDVQLMDSSAQGSTFKLWLPLARA